MIREGQSLYRTPAAAPATFTGGTFSAWVKRGQVGAANVVVSAMHIPTGTAYQQKLIFTGPSLFYYAVSAGAVVGGVQVPGRFTDMHGWYHIHVKWTDPGTFTITVNGQPLLVDHAVANMNATLFFGAGGWSTFVGGISNIQGLEGLVSEVHLVEGLALDAGMFGRADHNGVWVPREYRGSHGPGGFYLPFTDPTTPGLNGATNGAGNLTGGSSTSGPTAGPGGAEAFPLDTPYNNRATFNRGNLLNGAWPASPGVGSGSIIAVGTSHPTAALTWYSDLLNVPFPKDRETLFPFSTYFTWTTGQTVSQYFMAGVADITRLDNIQGQQGLIVNRDSNVCPANNPNAPIAGVSVPGWNFGSPIVGGSQNRLNICLLHYDGPGNRARFALYGPSPSWTAWQPLPTPGPHAFTAAVYGDASNACIVSAYGPETFSSKLLSTDDMAAPVLPPTLSGTFWGNGNANGPFIYTGCCPGRVQYGSVDVSFGNHVGNPDVEFHCDGFKVASTASNTAGTAVPWTVTTDHGAGDFYVAAGKVVQVPYGGHGVKPCPAIRS